MSKIIKFYDFCNNYCEKNEDKQICINKCKIILNNFFSTIEKYNNIQKIESFKILKKYEQSNQYN